MGCPNSRDPSLACRGAGLRKKIGHTTFLGRVVPRGGRSVGTALWLSKKMFWIQRSFPRLRVEPLMVQELTGPHILTFAGVS